MNDKDSITDFQMLKWSAHLLFVLALLSLLLMVPKAMAQQTAEAQPSVGATMAPVTQQVSASSTAKPFSPSPEVTQAAVSILQLVSNLPSGPLKNNFVVKVPSYNFVGILQELQNRNAKFVLPGMQAPSTAKAVFTLQSDKVGLSQVVYLTK